MEKVPYSPTVLLRCGRCRNKTLHVLVSFSNNPVLAISMVYECQECGETKKVFDLNTLSQVTWEPVTDIKTEANEVMEAKEEKEEKETTEEEKEPSIPIERGPQIEQSSR